MYVDNDFIWWISPRLLAIYFQINFFLKVTKNHLVMYKKSESTNLGNLLTLPGGSSCKS